MFSQHILRELMNESGLVLSIFLLHNPLKLSLDILNVISLIFALSPSFPMQKSDLISHNISHVIFKPCGFLVLSGLLFFRYVFLFQLISSPFIPMYLENKN
ncbi:hypothetical protein RchiOBHm_Chr4g0430301 [Rosa chinensis]|uniref:Uncharacterized protein n=1 Tax=Rosa chinensis TaxID=74649 RepID=A0A2P6R0E9_ROSCH|nr:hypothetical protein RchiOBHm_Chr4g0430301 [Rosa chinensis]